MVSPVVRGSLLLSGSFAAAKRSTHVYLRLQQFKHDVYYMYTSERCNINTFQPLKRAIRPSQDSFAVSLFGNMTVQMKIKYEHQSVSEDLKTYPDRERFFSGLTQQCKSTVSVTFHAKDLQ